MSTFAADPTADPASNARDLPTADRAWRLHCQGRSFSAIAEQLGLDRHTIARYIKQIHAATQSDRRADRSLALTQALGALAQIQLTAWDQIAQDQAHERLVWDAYARASAEIGTDGPGTSGLPGMGEPQRNDPPVRPPNFRSQTARLLTVILAALREVARLELLYFENAPARDGDEPPPPTEQDHYFYVMMRRSDREALAQLQRDEDAAQAMSTAPDDASEHSTASTTVEADTASDRTQPEALATSADAPATPPPAAPASPPPVVIRDINGLPPIPHTHPQPDFRPDGTDDWYVHSRTPLTPPCATPGSSANPGQPRRRPWQRDW